MADPENIFENGFVASCASPSSAKASKIVLVGSSFFHAGADRGVHIKVFSVCLGSELVAAVSAYLDVDSHSVPSKHDDAGNE